MVKKPWQSTPLTCSFYQATLHKAFAKGNTETKGFSPSYLHIRTFRTTPTCRHMPTHMYASVIAKGKGFNPPLQWRCSFHICSSRNQPKRVYFRQAHSIRGQHYPSRSFPVVSFLSLSLSLSLPLSLSQLPSSSPGSDWSWSSPE